MYFLILRACVICLCVLFLCRTPTVAIENPTPVTVVSAASYELHGIASGSIASAFGTKLATATATATDLDPTLPGMQLPETLAGTSVRINGQLAKLSFVSAGQVNFIVPSLQPLDLSGGAVSVQIIAGDGTESKGTSYVFGVLPSIFTANADGQGVLAANVVRVRNGVRLPPESLTTFDPVTQKFRAKPLDLGPPTDRVFLEVYGTGIRNADDPNGDGNVQENVWVLLGGQILTPTYAGRQPEFAGLDQVNFEIPRNLSVSGRLNLSIQARRRRSVNDPFEGSAAKPVELELAALPSDNPPQIAEFSPSIVLAGQTMTITGQGFATTAADNIVKIGGAIASVESASATRLTVRVPFGAASGNIIVQTPNGAGASKQAISLRTSISSYVALLDGSNSVTSGRSITTYSLRDIAVRVVGSNQTVQTNEHGVFHLTDVPAGDLYLEVDANITAATAQFPKVRFRVPVEAGRDNLIPIPIAIQSSNPVDVGMLLLDGRIVPSEPYLELADGAAVQYAEGHRPLAVTRISQLPSARPLAAQPYLFTGLPWIPLQITPSDATFTAGAKLVIPGSPGPLPISARTKVYRYDLTPGSATFGMLVDVTGGVFKSNGFSLTFEVPIKETGYYVVDTAGNSFFTFPTSIPFPGFIGKVLAADGKTPVNNALIMAGTQILTRTDDSGTYLVRSLVNGDRVTIQYLQPDGTVVRRTAQLDVDSELTAVPLNMKPSEPLITSGSGTMVMLPNTIRMKVNEVRSDNFLILGD